MKKIFGTALAISLILSTQVFGQIDLLGEKANENELSESKKTVAQATNNVETKTLPEADFFSDFIEDVEAEKKAQSEAKQLLNSNPEVLKLRQSQIKELEKNRLEREKLRQKFLQIEQEKMKPEEKIQNMLENYENAPLGFNWTISSDEMRQIGYEMEKVEREDYPNSYLIKNAAEKGAKGYENVIISFGENDSLWCINAIVPTQKDDSSAREILKLYGKYYEALEQKYGNAVEHFTAYSYEEKIVEGEGENAVERIVKKENPRGNPNFLNELKTGKAELYATFHNSKVGVTLSVYVDENNMSQLVLDYKNLPLMKKEKEAFINNL